MTTQTEDKKLPETVADTKAISDALAGGGKIEKGMTISQLIGTATIRKKFEEVLGPDKYMAFLSSIMSATSANPKLASAEPMSIIRSAMIAATLDLAINPSLGFAYIVPYKGIATFQIGWKGIYQLAMRSGQYRTINGTTVYDGELVKRDKFKGLMEFDSDGKKSDKVLGYVLYFETLNGFQRWFYMTAAQMEAHGKKYSQQYKLGKGLWKDDFEAAALKTIHKLGLKYGPLSIEMKTAFDSDQAAIDKDGNLDYIDAVVTPDIPFDPEDDKKKKEEDEQL